MDSVTLSMGEEGELPILRACLPKAGQMIQLTRLNNNPLLVNSDVIKSVEQSPDTVITLMNGEKILVRETAEQILRRIVAFRRALLRDIYPVCDHALPSAYISENDNREPANEG